MKFSIITPTYLGRENLLINNISYINNQSYDNWEHIIVYDSPFDYLPQNTNKRYFYHLENKSNNYGNTSRQKGLEVISESDYTIFFDDDNVLFPKALEILYNFIEKYNYPNCIISSIFHFGPFANHLSQNPQILNGEPPVLQNVDSLQFIPKTNLIKDHGWLLKGDYLADGYTIQSFTEKYNYKLIDDVLGIHI